MSEIKELHIELNTKLEKGFGDLQAKSDLAIKEIEAGKTVSNELKSAIDNAKGEIERIAESVQDLEQKGVKLQGLTEHKSFVDLIKSDDDYANVNKGMTWEKQIDKKELASMLSTKADTANLESETVDNTIRFEPRQALRIRDLLTTIPVNSAAYTYFKENSTTLAAAIVAEGGIKTEQTADFASVTDTVKKIAVWHRITMEQAQDYPQIQAYIRDLLRYDIKLAEETQLLKGDGLGDNLNGLYTQATAYDSAGLSAVGDTTIDTIRRMIYQVVKQSRYAASAIALTDKTWMDIELSKDANDSYMFANLQGVVTPVLWGRPVVTSESLSDTAEEILVGNFQRAAKVYDRMGYTVKVGMINDDFIRNQNLVLAEERIGLGVERPSALVKHQLGV